MAEYGDMAEYEDMKDWKDNKEYWNFIFNDISFNDLLGSVYDKVNKQHQTNLSISTKGIDSWLNLQYIAGFDLPEKVTLEFINPDSIFTRLYYLLGNSNILAVSEFIKKKKPEDYDLIKK
jgi:hypothetical protein